MRYLTHCSGSKPKRILTNGYQTLRRDHSHSRPGAKIALGKHTSAILCHKQGLPQKARANKIQQKPTCLIDVFLAICSRALVYGLQSGVTIVDTIGEAQRMALGRFTVGPGLVLRGDHMLWGELITRKEIVALQPNPSGSLGSHILREADDEAIRDAQRRHHFRTMAAISPSTTIGKRTWKFITRETYDGDNAPYPLTRLRST